MEPRSCGPIRGESGQKAKTHSGGGARGRERPLRRRVAHHGPWTRTECAGCHVLPRPRLASSTKGGPTVFAGFGVGQAGAQSGAVPLGAMQLSRCPDRSRLEAVTMPEEGPRPHANEARPRNLGKLMGGGGRGLSPASVHPSLASLPSLLRELICSKLDCGVLWCVVV